MDSKGLRLEKTFNLEKFIKVLETTYTEVCNMFGEDSTEPEDFLETDNCVFLFDSERQYIFCGAVIMSDSYGFFGIQVGANWLESAGKLESQGFKQADDLERFTKLMPDFGISVYLYPDDCPDVKLSTVKDYSISTRYGHAL